MTLLVPMRPETFAAVAEAMVADYAADKVAAGAWPPVGAIERARDEFVALLPQGLATPDNRLFELRASPDGDPVGYLWFAVDRSGGRCSVFVYNVGIDAAHRRRGHARAALVALESLAAAIGATGIALHVFGFNTAAQALYRSLGYTVTGIEMAKRLDGGPAAAARADD